jgi:hypothetical protein
LIGKRLRFLSEPALQWVTLSESALDSPTPSHPDSKLEMQMSPMAMQTAKDWASA